MDSRPSENLALVARIGEAARGGTWSHAAELTAALVASAPPACADELSEYLSALRKTLWLAKLSRSALAVSLNRLNAAATFNKTRVGG